MRDSNSSTNSSMNDSLKGGSPLLSPKINKIDSKDEDSKQQYLMKKRSPTKVYDEK